MARDAWGHGKLCRNTCSVLSSKTTGCPVCWMISSDGTSDALRFLFMTFRDHNPTVPQVIMSDRDLATINAVESVYPESTHLLCWWHVLHDWHGRLRVKEFSEVWTALQQLPRASTEQHFDTLMELIDDQAPPSFTEYLYKNWLTGMFPSRLHVNKLYRQLQRSGCLIGLQYSGSIFTCGVNKTQITCWRRKLS